MPKISLNYQNKLEINTTPTSGATWAELKKGFANLAENLNEVLYQASYLGDKGWGSTEVTGGQYIVTLTGVRYFADTAQDYIFDNDVMHEFGESRKTQLRITRGDNVILFWNITLANITQSGGDANQPAAISLAIHGNGAPMLGLTVVSVEGTTSGTTDIAVTPTLGSGNSYKYKLGTVVDIPAKGDVLTTGWTTWDGTADITVSSEQVITVAEVVTTTNECKKAGVTTVVALA